MADGWTLPMDRNFYGIPYAQTYGGQAAPFTDSTQQILRAMQQMGVMPGGSGNQFLGNTAPRYSFGQALAGSSPYQGALWQALNNPLYGHVTPTGTRLGGEVPAGFPTQYGGQGGGASQGLLRMATPTSVGAGPLSASPMSTPQSSAPAPGPSTQPNDAFRTMMQQNFSQPTTPPSSDVAAQYAKYIGSNLNPANAPAGINAQLLNYYSSGGPGYDPAAIMNAYRASVGPSMGYPADSPFNPLNPNSPFYGKKSSASPTFTGGGSGNAR